MLREALELAARGWAVFPCREGAKTPATVHGLKDATTDEAQIRAWWSERPYNIAVATGAVSGLYVLDVDDEQGVESLIDLSHSVPTHTLHQATPGGGYHFIFRHRGGLRNSAGKLGAGLDTRGDGGYIVVAPSQVDGKAYRWMDGGESLAGVPGWLLRWALPDPIPAPPVRTVLPRSSDNGPPKASYGLAALRGECDAVAGAVQSTRNHTLNVSAYKIGTLVGAGVIEVADAQAALLDASAACGLPEREARKTIWSGLAAGMKNPRQTA